ncbi:MAG: toll/interleukin-1 receptor domain-containing protein [Opitutae bacterium]|nr:toll/interleukin-1 receptor domain-containing protein [Opitutae bacterium]
MNYELFISYARKDNQPQKPGDPRGWVTALRDEILARHYRVSGAPLRSHPFYDLDAIKGMDDWRLKILQGLRQSNILLVCLSPNYFKSDNCLWEWEEFHKHKAARRIGDGSVAPVYFVEAPDSDEQVTAAFAAFVQRGNYQESELAKFIPRWREWHSAIRRFNHFDFRPWFPEGPTALAEEVAKRRLEELSGALTDRLARSRRAADAPGNLRGYNPHFVGRSKQLAELHQTLVGDGSVGVITAVNGLGGQGKTELAITYAHSHAQFYPGGLWVLPAEGRAELLPLFGELAGDARLGIPPSAGPEETAAQRGVRVLERMKQLAVDAHDRDPDGGAACLVILDNVSEPALLSKTQRAPLDLASKGWLRLAATTRLGRADFPATASEVAFMEITSLDEDDALDLIRNHQPPLDADGVQRDFPPATAAADATAAREIARELGGFTLAVEAVAIYLGLHPEIRPAAYLARLRAEGLTGVDSLPAEADVAAQMQHREKQLELVLAQTFERLTPLELTALDYAALLPPDHVPWPWLRALVAEAHPGKLDAAVGHPDPWAGARRRLEGLRLLTTGDHPEVARLHRMVGAHVRERLGDRVGGMRARVLQLLHDRVGYPLQETWRHDPGVLWILPPLQATVELLAEAEVDPMLGRLAGLLGEIEATIGRLDRAERFLMTAMEITEKALATNPSNTLAQRDVSLSLINLADYLASRGQAGDGEKALGYYERSLAVTERLAEANPQSAQAQRDVSVSLNKLADFLARRGQAGDGEKALGYYERSLAVRERLAEANPQSAQAQRDLSVSLEKLADFLAQRGQAGDGENALGYYERSLAVRERLAEANPQSAQAQRDVSVSLNKLADFLARRGQAGDGEKALGYYERSLAVRERLAEANPQSAEAQRDVSVSLERLAGFEGRQAGGEGKALQLQLRALEIAFQLRSSNPQSVYFGRTAAVSFFLTYQRAHAAGQNELAMKCLAGCFQVLDQMITAGCALDEQMVNLHAQLKTRFGQS